MVLHVGEEEGLRGFRSRILLFDLGLFQVFGQEVLLLLLGFRQLETYFLACWRGLILNSFEVDSFKEWMHQKLINVLGSKPLIWCLDEELGDEVFC